MEALSGGGGVVEQADQGTDHPGLGLAPLAQEDDVVPCEQGVLQLWEDGLLVAEHPREERGALDDASDGVGSKLVFDAA